MKGGLAFRTLQVDRLEINDVQASSPELQAGLAYRINEQSAITLSYQVLLGNKPELMVNSETETGFLHNIPTQQSVMIGFSYRCL